jgi:hypothetical protein
VRATGSSGPVAAPSCKMRVMRERWFGATGRKVPAIVVEGTLDLSGALVLDDVSDLDAIHQAHHAGTPVVVRCASADEVHSALSLGHVACALVTDESLLSLDLAEMTYG